MTDAYDQMIVLLALVVVAHKTQQRAESTAEQRRLSNEMRNGEAEGAAAPRASIW